MVMDLHRRHVIAGVIVSEIGWPLYKHCPRVEPQPELLLLVRVERQVVGLSAVTLKKARQGLPGIHDTEITGVVDQLLVPVWRWRSGCHKAVFDSLEQIQKRLIRLATETAQH